MCQEEYETAVAAFTRSNGIIRCPTACALPAQGTVPEADRAALQSYAATRNLSRQAKIAARQGAFGSPNSLAGRGE